MRSFKETVGKKILVMDGAMGTELMARGVRPEECFDAQNLKNPEIVESVHKLYVEAGADIIETNTFGANRIKLKDYGLDEKVGEVNMEAVRIAKRAAKDNAFVCGSIGPLGKMIEPLGEVSFDEACAVFAEQAKALEKGGADVVSIETISDLQEMRAAVIAVKNETKLPIIASMTYDDGEKTIYGTPPEAAVVVLEALGIDIISANCSTGPEGLLKIAERYLAATTLPVMVMPNAGMPELVGNRAVYKMTPDQFGAFAQKFAKLGVSIIGGCCGTGPEHIQAVKSKIQMTKSLPVRPASPRGEQAGKIISKSKIQTTKFASRTRVVEVEEEKIFAVGERINPTGRKIFQEEIKSGKTQIIRTEAAYQSKAGADLLDINVSVPDIQEHQAMAAAVRIVQSVSDLPLSIDSPSPYSVETGLKQFCGRALLNSVNGKKESLEKILPIAKRYGAAIIALALDESGIPASAGGRLKIAEKIVRAAESYGFKKEDIFVDALVMTAGIGIEGSIETLNAISLIKEKLGVKTILGISNVSHGMPDRSKLNALYLELAAVYGLSAAIVDVTDHEIQKAIKALKGKKAEKGEKQEGLLEAFRAEVDKAKRSGKPAEKKKEAVVKDLRVSGYQDIKEAVIDGNIEAVEILVNQAIDKNFDPQKIINEGLAPGMEIVGRKFSSKEYFLPQVIESAEAMSRGFVLCKAKIPQEQIKIAGKIILATVKGDIHDIGKNIVKMLLENHGFQVIDLGKDVPPEIIIESAKREKPNAIALSALLTTTMIEMEVVKKTLEKENLSIPLLVGGAVVTKGYADRIGAVYSMDAVGAVELAKKIIKAAKG